MPVSFDPKEYEAAEAQKATTTAAAQPDTSEADAANPNSPAYVGAPSRFLSAVGSRLPNSDTLGGIANALPGMVKEWSGAGMAEAYDNGEGIKAALKRHPAVALWNTLHGAGASMNEAAGEKFGMGDTAGGVGVYMGEVFNGLLGAGNARAVGGPIEDVMKAESKNMWSKANVPRKVFRDKAVRQEIIKGTESFRDLGLDEFVNRSERGVQRAVKLKQEGQRAYNRAYDPEARVPYDRLDEVSANAQAMPEFEMGGDSVRNSMKATQNRIARIKFQGADPAEITKAKDAIAMQRNADAVVYNLNNPVPPGPSIGGPQPMKQTWTGAEITDGDVMASPYKSTIKVSKALDAKRQFTNDYTTPGRQLQPDFQADKLVQKGAMEFNESVFDTFPELRPLGEELSKRIDLEAVAKEAFGRGQGESIAGAATPGVFLKLGGPKALIYHGLAKIYANKALRSNIASLMYKASGGMKGLADVTGRMAAVSEEFRKAAVEEEKEEQAKQAKP